MKIQEIRGLSSLIGKIQKTSLGVPEIKALVALNKNLGAAETEFSDIQKEIMEAYKLKPNEENRYDWTKHKKSEEITAKLNSLFIQDFEILATNLNFLSEEQLFTQVGQDFSINELTFMSDFLISNDTTPKMDVVKK